MSELNKIYIPAECYNAREDELVRIVFAFAELPNYKYKYKLDILY